MSLQKIYSINIINNDFNIYSSGVYAIRNINTSKVYVGSTKEFCKRFKGHLGLLERNKHYNNHLQSSWNKHPRSSFVFELLEEVMDIDKLTIREQYWIDLLDSYRNGYNNAPRAGSMLGFKHSEETKNRISILKTGIKKSEKTKLRLKESLILMHSNFSEEERVRRGNNISKAKTGSKHHMSKLKEDDVVRIKILLGNTKIRQHEIAEMYNVDRYTISEIKRNETWKHVKVDDINEIPREIFEIENYYKERRRKNGVGAGEKASISKLKEVQVIEIKKMLNENVTSAEIARIYGVSKSTIQSIKKGRSWTHII